MASLTRRIRSLAPLAALVLLSHSASSKDGPPNGRDVSPFADALRLVAEGRETFRFDTFGDEAFWGETLRLHEALAQTTPRRALELGLKIDADALPRRLASDLRRGRVNLDDPANTVALLKQDAVVGITGIFDPAGRLVSVGTQCALCHSSVDDSLLPGVGRRLDGWANRDLDVGAIVALAPNLQPFSDLLGVNIATVKKVLQSWGPGRYDAELDKDGKAFRPDGKPAATLLPPAFGLAGVNLHTWTGFGSIPYWNAYVATTQMHGTGTFFDTRFNDRQRYPVAARAGTGNVRSVPDKVAMTQAPLHFYQLSIPAPKPPADSFDKEAAGRGEKLFNKQARCASCHVPPLFTEPGNNLHAANEIGIDDFQALRSPTGKYRTAPLAGLWTHQKGGFYHDGRFANLREVVDHYDDFLRLSLSDQQKQDLVEYLKSL